MTGERKEFEDKNLHRVLVRLQDNRCHELAIDEFDALLRGPGFLGGGLIWRNRVWDFVYAGEHGPVYAVKSGPGDRRIAQKTPFLDPRRVGIDLDQQLLHPRLLRGFENAVQHGSENEWVARTKAQFTNIAYGREQ